MTENNLTYYCPICITDFTDKGIQPFECLHILCNDCNKEFSKLRLYYKCPLCKSDYKNDLIDKYITADVEENKVARLIDVLGGRVGG